jgi:argininosuccinate lyase
MTEHNNEDYKLWGGRFEARNDHLMKMFNDSLPVDKRLWREDIIVISPKHICLFK